MIEVPASIFCQYHTSHPMTCHWSGKFLVGAYSISRPLTDQFHSHYMCQQPFASSSDMKERNISWMKPISSSQVHVVGKMIAVVLFEKMYNGGTLINGI